MESLPIVADNVVIEDFSTTERLVIDDGFSNAVFRRVKLNGPTFVRTSLLGLIRRRIDLKNDQFEQTDFGSLIAHRVHFADCKFVGCTFGGTTFQARFSGCRASNCHFVRTRFKHIDFYGCDFEQCSFEQCQFVDCQWNNGSFNLVRIQGSMSKCRFFGIRVQELDLTEVEFEGYTVVDAETGTRLNLPFNEGRFFVRQNDEVKILDALQERLSSASRVRVGNTLSKYPAPGVTLIERAAFDGLPSSDQETVMATARRFAVTEFPFGRKV